MIVSSIRRQSFLVVLVSYSGLKLQHLTTVLSFATRARPVAARLSFGSFAHLGVFSGESAGTWASSPHSKTFPFPPRRGSVAQSEARAVRSHAKGVKFSLVTPSGKVFVTKQLFILGHFRRHLTKN